MQAVISLQASHAYGQKPLKHDCEVLIRLTQSRLAHPQPLITSLHLPECECTIAENLLSVLASREALKQGKIGWGFFF